MKKGISPLVAAVLLIASTMSIAGILAYWASSFVRSSLPEGTNKTDIECSGSNFGIYYSSYNITTQNLTLILENKGSYTVHITGIDAFYPNAEVKSYTFDQLLPVGGRITRFIVENVGTGLNKIRIVTNCPNLYKETSI